MGENGAPDVAEKPSCRLCTWGKLALVAVVAAVLGAFVAANWNPRSYSLIFATAKVNTGLVILASAAIGFVLGVLFLWSALTHEGKD